VAAKAGVPLGNVYDDFKTKEDLLGAVVRQRAEVPRSTPVERLCAVVDTFRSRADDLVRLGCPYGSLASDLEKRDGVNAGILFVPHRARASRRSALATARRARRGRQARREVASAGCEHRGR